MLRPIFLIVLLFFSTLAHSQKRSKPKLIVFGQGEMALAAAVQASKSGVSTLWLNPASTFSSKLTEGNDPKSVNSDIHPDAGLWAEFLRLSVNAVGYTDSIFNRAKTHISPRIAINTFNKMLDSATNLTVLYNSGIREIKRSGKKRWQVKLTTGETYKVYSILDASTERTLTPLVEVDEQASKTDGFIKAEDLYNSQLFKTSVWAGTHEGAKGVAPAALLIKPYAYNFFIAYNQNELLNDFKADANSVPLLMTYGQSMGATAAYCAFFETEAKEINIRTLQGELMTFNGRLLPFRDIRFEDIHRGQIERIGLTGIIKADVGENGSLIFNPDSLVSTQEIESVMRSIYTRSQIWFRENSFEQMRLKDLLSLIKFVALKGDELDKSVENGWRNRFNFSSKYDPECFVTRRQTAVLIDSFLSPFGVKIDRTGSFRY